MIELIQHAIVIQQERIAELSFNGLEGHLGQRAFNREFKTIHINIGRRVGKTFAIGSLAKLGDLIIVHNVGTKDRMIHDYPRCNAGICTISDLIENLSVTQKFDYIWIDEPNLCENYKDINSIYDILDANLFIKLGE